MMDERKRTFDQDDESVGQQKRVRPEELLGALRDDTSHPSSRVLLDKAQFARVIGRAGQTIAHIRTTTGARVKGTDLTDTDRLVIMAGSTAEVTAAFDAMLMALFCNTDATNPASYDAARAGEDRVIVNLLVEHSKAGRLVGAKGINIHSLKQRSGALVRVEKDPLEFAGVLMRKVSLEGTMSAVARAHGLIQELYAASGAPPASPCFRNAGGEVGREGQRSCPPSPSLSSLNSAYSLPPQVATPSSHSAGARSRGGGAGGTGEGTGGGTGGGGGAAFLAMSDAFGRSLPSDIEPEQGGSSRWGGRSFGSHGAQQSGPHIRHPYPHAQPHAFPYSYSYSYSYPYSHPLPERYPASAGIAVHWQPQEACAHQQLPALSQHPPLQQATAAHTPVPQESQLGRDHLADSTQSQNDPHRELDHRRTAELWASPLSASSLLQLGVPMQEVVQLVDLQTFLLRNFGLELAVKAAPDRDRQVRRRSSSSGMSAKEGGADAPVRTCLEDEVTGSSTGTDIEKIIAERRRKYERQVGPEAAGLQLLFAIPACCVGAVIGRGGKGLRDLQAQFGVRVYVEREDYLGQRIVVLTAVSAPTAGATAGPSRQVSAVAMGAKEPQKDIDDQHHDRQQPPDGDRGSLSDSIQKEAPLKAVEADVDAGAEAAPDAQGLMPEAAQLSLKARCRERDALELGDASPLDGRGGGAHKRNRTDEGGGDLASHSVEPGADKVATCKHSSAAEASDPLYSDHQPPVAIRHISAVTTVQAAEQVVAEQAKGTSGPAARAADRVAETRNDRPKQEEKGREGLEGDAAEVMHRDRGGAEAEGGNGEGASSDDDSLCSSTSVISSSSSSSVSHGRRETSGLSAHGDGETRQAASRAKRKRTSQSSASPEHPVVSTSPLGWQSGTLGDCEGRSGVRPAAGPRAALLRCKERVEALVEDALQKKDLQTNDSHSLL